MQLSIVISIVIEMEMKLKVLAIFGILIFFFSILGHNAKAQDTSCVNQLSPCLSYLNGTRNPPDSCCGPLKDVIEWKPDCICTLISNQGSRQAEQAGINVNEAQQLPARCGIHINPLACLSGSPGSGTPDQESGSVMVFPLLCMKVAAASFLTAQILLAFNSL